MNYKLIREVISLAEEFESQASAVSYSSDLNGFKSWICEEAKNEADPGTDPDWEGRENGRSAESVINTLIVSMNRYAKTYSRSAICNSAFSTQEEFIYLINLRAFGAMTKMELIKKNVHDKPSGMQVINRLIRHGWVKQTDSVTDKRSKIIQITDKGLETLDKQMKRIRQATQVVTGDLTYPEKMDLIRLLTKLEAFHKPIFLRNLEPAILLDKVFEDKKKS